MVPRELCVHDAAAVMRCRANYQALGRLSTGKRNFTFVSVSGREGQAACEPIHGESIRRNLTVPLSIADLRGSVRGPEARNDRR